MYIPDLAGIVNNINPNIATNVIGVIKWMTWKRGRRFKVTTIVITEKGLAQQSYFTSVRICFAETKCHSLCGEYGTKTKTEVE